MTNTLEKPEQKPDIPSKLEEKAKTRKIVVQEVAVRSEPSQDEGPAVEEEKQQASSTKAAPSAQDALRVMRQGADKVAQGAQKVRQEAENLWGKSRKLSFHAPEWVLEPFRRQKKYTPAADFAMRGDIYEISVELPGLDEKDINVRMAGGEIIVSGQKSAGQELDQAGFFFQERAFGAFERSFRIPNDADPTNIDARIVNAVLIVKLPRVPHASRPERKIEVKLS